MPMTHLECARDNKHSSLAHTYTCTYTYEHTYTHCPRSLARWSLPTPPSLPSSKDSTPFLWHTPPALSRYASAPSSTILSGAAQVKDDKGGGGADRHTADRLEAGGGSEDVASTQQQEEAALELGDSKQEGQQGQQQQVSGEQQEQQQQLLQQPGEGQVVWRNLLFRQLGSMDSKSSEPPSPASTHQATHPFGQAPMVGACMCVCV